jgi:anti-sigma factor RsiW
MTSMDCGEVRDILQAYEDGELSETERSAVGQHLHRCCGCHGVLVDLQGLRNRIRSAGTFTIPSALETRVRSAIGLESRRPPIAGWRNFAALTASHIMMAAISGVIVYTVLSHRDIRMTSTHEVVSAHVRAMLTDQLVQVVSADTHTVRPWFAGRVPFAPDVVDLSSQGFPLLGGRVDYVLDQPAAAMVYGRRKHRINLFALPLRQVRQLATFSAAQSGYNVVSWQTSDFAYFAVSDLNSGELQTFAQALGKKPSAK